MVPLAAPFLLRALLAALPKLGVQVVVPAVCLLEYVLARAARAPMDAAVSATPLESVLARAAPVTDAVSATLALVVERAEENAVLLLDCTHLFINTTRSRFLKILVYPKRGNS